VEVQRTINPPNALFLALYSMLVTIKLLRCRGTPVRIPCMVAARQYHKQLAYEQYKDDSGNHLTRLIISCYLM